MNPKRPQPTRPTGSPTKPCSSEIVAHQIPTIILTQPTPPPFSADRMPTPQQPTFQTPPRPHQLYQSPPRRLFRYQTQTPPPTPPLRTVPRAAEDVQAMLNAMASGRFDVPIFGDAGVAFHQEEGRKGEGEGGMTPRIDKKARVTRKKVEQVDEDMDRLQTQTPRPKRKRATKVTKDEEEGGVQKKARVVRKKVEVEDAQQPT